MTSQINKALQDVWYSTGVSQFFLYGIWTVIISSNFAFSGWYAVIPAVWKFNGVAIIAAIIWCELPVRQLLILANTFLALMVGALYLYSAAVSGVELRMSVSLHGASAGNFMAIFFMVVWGYYLANLISRQRLEMQRAGIEDV